MLCLCLVHRGRRLAAGESVEEICHCRSVCPCMVSAVHVVVNIVATDLVAVAVVMVVVV